jgi:hypothetical protein
MRGYPDDVTAAAALDSESAVPLLSREQRCYGEVLPRSDSAVAALRETAIAFYSAAK